MIRNVVLHAFILSFFLQSYAQSTYVGGLFPTIDHSGKITKRTDYSLYYFGAFPLLNLKNPDIARDANMLLLYAEQALTFQLSKRLFTTGSYVYQKERIAKNTYLNENRFHIQATYKHSANRINFKHRLRLDNRFVHNPISGETPYTHRLRYLLGCDIPIRSKKDNMYFTAYEEAFFNTFRNAGAVYGENWLYAAVGTKLNPRNKVETGPLYITWNTGGNNWFHQFYLQLTWISQVDFSKQAAEQ